MWIKNHFCKLNRSRYFHWKKNLCSFFFDWWKSLISSTIKIKADALQLIVLWSSMILFDVTFLICVVFRISQHLNIRQLGLLLIFASNFHSIYWLMMAIPFFISLIFLFFFLISPKRFLTSIIYLFYFQSFDIWRAYFLSFSNQKYFNKIFYHHSSTFFLNIIYLIIFISK